MKIAIVSDHPAVPVDICSPLARELGRQGHQVTMYARRGASDIPDRVRLAPGATVEHLSAKPNAAGSLDHIQDFATHLGDRCTRDRPDVLHAHHWTGGLAAIAAADDLGTPIVQTFGGLAATAGRGTDQPERVRLERAIGRRADAVIASSADEQLSLLRLGVPRRSITMVPRGVDGDRFRPHGHAFPRSERSRLLCVGGLAEHTGVDTAVRALGHIPDAELVVAGGPQVDELDGDPNVHRLRLLAKETGIDDRVTFLGEVAHSSMPKLMRSADVVLSLSRHAPLGNVALEAMACGVPVVASAVGGHLDTVIDGVTGVLVPPDRPAVIARTTRALLADHTRRAAFSIAGTDRALSRHSWERIGREIVAVYERAVTAAQPDPASARPTVTPVREAECLGLA